jgi:hypothetical protein
VQDKNAARKRKPARRDTIPERVRKQVARRDDGQCVKCARPAGHQHHRRLKGIGGDPRPHTDCACNLVSLCHDCHEWAHKKGRARAEAEGLIIPNSELSPWLHSVMVHDESGSGVTAWPCCDGHYTAIEPEGAAA